ncbi:hypothetical protein [Caballeronia sordidicola]|jgi:hypothetical protein|uniref:hypothetical protein n=1 Tax=Caballeronia sordidicola TaxID=196367 RepID=UPI00117D6E4A|nr:hypothetical protein [Caballeronia sordidicola]
MNIITLIMRAIGFLALGYACESIAGATNMTERVPTGAQDPQRPHPGTITAKYDWDGSTEFWKASDLPDSFTFRCFNENGKRTSRANAAWCIPVVEVETVSSDEQGNPVAPNEADSVSNSIYGPGHTFLEHTSSPPHLKQQRELDTQQRSAPLEDATSSN